jgi:DNA-binding MarR family transcriptional regulator
LRSLRDITPTRLTNRLRQLEANGVVIRTRLSTGREVWYELTDPGHDLWPVVDTLTVWGIEHAFESPHPGELVNASPVMIGTKAFLIGRAGRLRGQVVWAWRFPGDDQYTIRSEENGWTLARGEPDTADVVVDTTLEAWARFLTARRARTLPRRDIRLSGTSTAIRKFAKAFAAEPASP